MHQESFNRYGNPNDDLEANNEEVFVFFTLCKNYKIEKITEHRRLENSIL